MKVIDHMYNEKKSVIYFFVMKAKQTKIIVIKNRLSFFRILYDCLKEKIAWSRICPAPLR